MFFVICTYDKKWKIKSSSENCIKREFLEKNCEIKFKFLKKDLKKLFSW